MSLSAWTKLSVRLTVLLSTVALNNIFSVQAQIIPDNTLPTLSEVPNGCTVCPITGGTLSNDSQTIFHSFQQFSVPGGGAALFQNDPSLSTIVTRVTGPFVSDID
ncbi:MAG: filamentous hemagglutinin N-terminal domain-containing protein, partial [Cyanobacteria bacterium P01_F01_bin.116]